MEGNRECDFYFKDTAMRTAISRGPTDGKFGFRESARSFPNFGVPGASRSLFRGRFISAVFTERPNYFVFLRPVEIVDP